MYQFKYYNYDDNNNKTGETLNQQVYYAYTANNRKRWLLQQVVNEDKMEDLFEEKYEYDDNGNLTQSAVWDWKDGKRKPTNRSKYTYDGNNKVVEYIGMRGEGGIVPIGAPLLRGKDMTTEDEEGWTNSARWTYVYENGCLVDKKGYTWRNDAWSTNSGQEVEYDWDYRSSDAIFPNGWTDPYKINVLRTLYSDGNNGWIASTRTYFYSELKPTDINTVKNNIPSVIVYPTYVTDYLYIEYSEQNVNVNIYGVGGLKIISTSDKKIDMSNVATGIYIVDVNGKKVKVLKK